MESTFEHDILHSSIPVLVDFWAPWCGPCRLQLPMVEEIGRGEAGRARVLKVNVDEQPELAERFRIASIPTLLVFSNGRVRERFVGVESAATLRRRSGRLPPRTARRALDEAIGRERAPRLCSSTRGLTLERTPGWTLDSSRGRTCASTAQPDGKALISAPRVRSAGRPAGPWSFSLSKHC
ncbi:MAG: thioredoxin [Acidobacteria bacterium]|nr:thioredoxin [Acidobacteriota bacterium]